MRRVLSLGAELAVSRINQTLALNTRREAEPNEPWRGRLHGTSGVVRSDPAKYLVLPHIVAIAEEFSRRLLIEKTEPFVPQTRPVMEELWARAVDHAEGRWESHLQAWKDWHQIALASQPAYSGLRPFIEARNAIMHGLGELTRRQRRGNQAASLRGELRSVGIEVIGIRLVVREKAVFQCAVASTRFIRDVDEQAQLIT